ncbi:MAG: hypothetical protein WBR18_12015 [Anaerolineales bacterium]
MPDQLRTTLEQMDAWIAARGPDPEREVPRADVARWSDSLNAAVERFDALVQAAQSAVDAYLLRSSASSSRARSTRGDRRTATQEHMKRISAAMIALEREVALMRAEVLPSAPSPAAEESTDD